MSIVKIFHVKKEQTTFYQVLFILNKKTISCPDNL